ncbi:MAG: DeoR/GlpR family DNA-binding transcription regulator [Firmicutes bacterium]|nr:DeoR/GlpR family DNA-binding transcription regulator [Bacillota bacterium]
MGDAQVVLFPEERRQKILALLEQRTSMTVGELAAGLLVSEATVRRDLDDLQRAGLVRRTHGGAMLAVATRFEPSFREKEDKYIRDKEAIGARAATLVRDGETIILDAGTTTLQVARNLRDCREVVVITNATNFHQELANNPGIEVILVGGTARANTFATVGPIAQQVLAGFHADKVFLAGNGLTIQHGLTTPNLLEAYTKRAMVDAAREIIVVLDHSKFNKVTATTVIPVGRIDKLVTDQKAPPEMLKELSRAGVEVVVA